MSHRLGFWIAHFNIVAVCAVLLGAFGVQFGNGELPCPLCVLQRMGMLLCALGPAHIIWRARLGEVDVGDFAAGYGMSVLGAVAGGSVAVRQILLHIKPHDKGFGEPVMGLHLYTWSLIVFVTVVVVSGLNLMFATALRPRGVRVATLSKLVLWLLGIVIAANLVTVFCEEGVHPTLPDEPTQYMLFDDLGWRHTTAP